MNIETAMADIVAADLAAKRRVAGRPHSGTLVTAIVGLCLVAVVFGGMWFAYVESNARLVADRMPTDAQTIVHVATIRVFKDYCPLNVPYKLQRVLESYANNNQAVGAEEYKIRKDIASTAMLAGMARFMACPAVQAQLDADAALKPQ